MAPSLGDNLLDLADRLTNVAARVDDAPFSGPLAALQSAAEAIGSSWSHSSLGYHSLVYYAGLSEPPPGAHFSPEWGLMSMMGGSTGDWREHTHDEVLQNIEARAGNPNLESFRLEARQAEQVYSDAHDDVLSILRALLRSDADEHLTSLVARVGALRLTSYSTYLKSQLPSGQIMSRDAIAIGQGIRSAPHQEVIAQVVAIRSPFVVAGSLAALCRQAARHLARIGGNVAPAEGRFHLTGRVVIGHGHSPLWRELKDFVADRVGIQWDEFNRVATAGVATSDRLQQMVESSTMALLVATAEDESSAGGSTARQNVVHEIGLFQGHLGFGRAIVLLEEGCDEFSNIHGLGQIRFPKGNIAACFEDVRRVLEREGLL